MTILYFSDIIISEGNRNAKKFQKRMVLDMLDVENVKNVLQAEVYKREKAKAKFYKYRSSGNKSQEDFYKRRYNLYCNRFDGMCDMLYDLGYLAIRTKL